MTVGNATLGVADGMAAVGGLLGTGGRTAHEALTPISVSASQAGETQSRDCLFRRPCPGGLRE